MDALRSNLSTPSSSPGLFSPTNHGRHHAPSISDGTPSSSPFLHPLKMNKVKECVVVFCRCEMCANPSRARTHKGIKDQDVAGRKRINQYVMLGLLGAGEAGKVKLAEDTNTGERVAIKIVNRFSKRRRLGKVTVGPEDKTKREIAILKKVRHPNIVGLLEVIDDPEWKKIYMVLEYVEYGEFPWRMPGHPLICYVERRRYESLCRRDEPIFDAEAFYHTFLQSEHRRPSITPSHRRDPLLLGDHFEGEDAQSWNRQGSSAGGHQIFGSQRSATSSRTHSRAPSQAASSRAQTPYNLEFDIPSLDSDNEHDAGDAILSHSNNASSVALASAMYVPYLESPTRGRSPSMAESHQSYMSSMADLIKHDAFEEDFAGLPCVTMDVAQRAFREMVLGLEYLHYEGIVHRDLKPSNILYTADHRIKISDFGVSYFGKPTREIDPEEISEADATDFDDDLELAKTVGTPAFFPPELCNTDLDAEQPKINEQIDIWSLGVTLYCMIYSRVPFLASETFKLFRAIATEDVVIPRRRLRPVRCPIIARGVDDPSYRQPSELLYEEIDDDLYDLLRRMLIKNPADRIRLREIKRHPWVVRGIDNVIGWLDDTDPSRHTAVSKVQVNKSELDHAVVPITILGRMRSFTTKTVKKVGQVIGATKSDRSEGSRSRNRAASSVTSSDAESTYSHLPHVTPAAREILRRPSLRDDADYFATIRDINEHRERESAEHPLAQSLTVSPDRLPYKEAGRHSSSVGHTPRRVGSYNTRDVRQRPEPLRAPSNATSVQTVIHRGHSHTRSLADSPHRARRIAEEIHPVFPEPPLRQPSADYHDEQDSLNKTSGRDYLAPNVGSTARARSVSLGAARGGSRNRSVSIGQRGVLVTHGKSADASVAMSPTVAPGTFELQRPSATDGKPLPSPIFPGQRPGSEEGQHQLPFRRSYYADMDESPTTAQLVERVLIATDMGQRPSSSRTNSSHRGRGRGMSTSSQKQSPMWQGQDSIRRHDPVACDKAATMGMGRLSTSSLAVSADGSRFAESSPSANSSVLSPGIGHSGGTSPISSTAGEGHASVPSLTALGSRKASLLVEGDGAFSQQSMGLLTLTERGTPSTLTPQSLSKQTSVGSEPPSPVHAANPHAQVALEDPDEGYQGDGDIAAERSAGEEDSDSDSDDGMIMMKSRHRASRSHNEPLTPIMDTGRRGTNASIGSMETAKKVSMDPT